MINIIPVQSDKLKANQCAFHLDNGMHSLIELTRSETDPNHPNQQEHYVCIKVIATHVDDQLEPILDEKNKPIQCSAKVESILSSALAEGALTIEDEMARMSADAVQRLANHIAARQAWARLPL